MTPETEPAPVAPRPMLRTRLAQAQRGLDPHERLRVMEDVALRTEDGWMLRFAIMLGLSVVVAVMGLSADSGPVVIGAMLLAPLMKPVMGLAAALAMALPRHLVRSLLVVGCATGAAVLMAFVLATVLPDPVLSSEVLARTSPDLRDLVVALAAGVAGAYATVRPDVSSALPGVAMAIALVPPLAAIGITMQLGRGDLVRGAVLLYVANLLAMVLMATLVFLVTGFVPSGRLAARRSRVVAGGLVVCAATAAVAVPLTVASIAAAEAGDKRAQLHEAAIGWIAGSVDELDEVRVSGDVVRVEVSGPNPPPDTAGLERAVEHVLGLAGVLEVRWTQTHDDGATGALVAVRNAVDEWAAGVDGIAVGEVTVADDRVEVALLGPRGLDAAEVGALESAVREAAGRTVTVDIWLTRREHLTSD